MPIFYGLPGGTLGVDGAISVACREPSVQPGRSLVALAMFGLLVAG